MAERVTPKKQHSAPEYLEKRKQERERRKSETGLRARLRSRARNSDAGISTKVVHYNFKVIDNQSLLNSFCYKLSNEC